jgi:hypothetical protein
LIGKSNRSRLMVTADCGIAKYFALGISSNDYLSLLMLRGAQDQVHPRKRSFSV